MRQDITVPSSTDVAIFDPKETSRNDAKLAAVIEYAKRVKDWPLLEQAVDQKLKEQAEFVQWWDDSIRSKGESRKENPDLRFLSVDQAEQATDISQQQVSKWRKRLQDVDTYRTKLYGKAWKEAFGTTAAHVANNSGENEWYTPPEFIEAARAVMSCPNDWHTAEHFTASVCPACGQRWEPGPPVTETLAEIDRYQVIQKQRPPSSQLWQDASEALAELFAEMAQRQ